MRKMIATLVCLLCFTTSGFAGGVPEGAIWDWKGVDAFGHAIQMALMIRHGHLIKIQPKGTQYDFGEVKLDQYNEYEVPPELFKRYWPDSNALSYKFSQDMKSVVQTHIQDPTGCIGGNCSNVTTMTYNRR